MKRKVFKKELHRLWGLAKNDLDKVFAETSRLVKKGETYIKDKSEEGRQMLEVMIPALQREKLYYELGKTLAHVSKNRWVSSKKVERFLIKIKKLNQKIKQASKK